MKQLQVFKSEILGIGGFGKVYKGSYFRLPVAVKKLKKSHIGTDAMEDFMKEIKIIMCVFLYFFSLTKKKDFKAFSYCYIVWIFVRHKSSNCNGIYA